MRILTTSLLLLIFSTFSIAQYASQLVPRVSSDNSISERVAYTKISIDYGSPKVKGRKIWGEMEEYGQIWRAGANKATQIAFSEDVIVKGKPLLKGVYSLFVIPEKEDPWTIIFNKVYDQWGAFSYDEEEDAIRIEVEPSMNHHVEDLTFDILAKDFEGADVTLEWEKIKLSFFVDVEYITVLEKMLEETTKELPENIHWVSYLQAATFLVDKEEKLTNAEKWLKKSSELYSEDGEWSGQYYPKSYIYGDLLWAKAKLAALNQDYKLAINLAEEMKALPGDYQFYNKENEAESIDDKMADWSKKVNE